MTSTRLKSEELEQPVDEVERFINLQRRVHNFRIKYNLPFPKQKSESKPVIAEGPQNHPLKYYDVPSQEEPYNNITSPAINRNDIELKPSLLSVIQQNQFSGSPTNNPNLHLSVFV